MIILGQEKETHECHFVRHNCAVCGVPAKRRAKDSELTPRGLVRKMDMIRVELREGNLTVGEYIDSIAALFDGDVSYALRRGK